MKSIINPINLVKALTSICLSLSLIACGSGDYVEYADRNDVITLGDSIFDASGEIQRILEQKAGETFRDYTQSGAELHGGFLARSVYDQYNDAKATNRNIKTIVMNGGGNDILIPAMTIDPYGCRTYWWRKNISGACRNLINDQYVRAVNLMNRMKSDRVNDVIYLGYYKLPRDNSNLNKAVNYGAKKLIEACNNTTVNCQFVDPRSKINGSHVLSDNIHPNASGSKILADLIWPKLRTKI